MFNLLSKRHFSKALERLQKQFDRKEVIAHLEGHARVQYRQYPYLPHQDSHSKEFLASEIDDSLQQREVQVYNKIIDDFKSSIKLQTHIWEMLKNLDRPYLKGRRGVDQNLYDQPKDYGKLGDLGFKRMDQSVSPRNMDIFYESNNVDRWIMHTPYHQKYPVPKNQQERLQTIRNRPINRHFNPQKGSKYDVPIPDSQKIQYLADRLGHPETVGTPIQRLLRLDSDFYHPGFLDQPFVKMPSKDASESLNFAKGQTVYQNIKVKEGTKGLFYFTLGTLGFWAIYIPFVSLYRSHTLKSSFFIPFHNYSIQSVDILKLHLPLSALVISYAAFLIFRALNGITRNYAHKLTLSEDKQLLFVEAIQSDGTAKEKVYEMAHLQVIPPSIRANVQFLSSADQDGIWKITCQNSKDQIWVYNNPKMWNPDLKKQFMRRVTNLWDKSITEPYKVEGEENAQRLPGQ